MTSPQLLQYHTGIGEANKRWRLITQSHSKDWSSRGVGLHVIWVPWDFVSVFDYGFREVHDFHEPLINFQDFDSCFAAVADADFMLDFFAFLKQSRFG
jgi:hypothetical protein